MSQSKNERAAVPRITPQNDRSTSLILSSEQGCSDQALGRRPQPGKLRAAAEWYASHRFPVFPCRPESKQPLTRHGFKDATTDPALVRKWWSRWPNANVAIPTGRVSGLFVVDVDPRNGGEQSWKALIESNPRLPTTAKQLSGGGGYHICFRYPPTPVRSGVLDQGIDIASDGHYILVAPSVHPNGRAYAWDEQKGPKALLELAELPNWLLERFSRRNWKDSHQQEGLGEQTLKWFPGERNNRLTTLAGVLRRRGASQGTIRAALSIEYEERCQPPLAEVEVIRIAESVSRYGWTDPIDENEPWPDPQPIANDLPAVKPFLLDLLPRAFRDWAQDISERMQVPMDYPAAVIVLCLSGITGRRAMIQPKANDNGWIVVPNLWGGIIASPGFMKSPVIHAALSPLTQIQAEWRSQFDDAMRNFNYATEEYDLRYAAWRESYKAHEKKKEAAPERPADRPDRRRARRVIVNDSTFEALHQTMSENPAGILVIRDELTGWLSQLDRAGREGERAFCLESWNGDSGFTIDRIGRGTIHVDACCLSIVGGIQPGRLRSYLSDALKDGPNNDGLMQRFQVLIWPDTKPDWTYVDRAPDRQSQKLAELVTRKLLNLDPGAPMLLRFSLEAQTDFMEWLAGLEKKVRSDEFHPALISHLSKYRKLMPALALLFELADWATTDGKVESVSHEHTQQAAEFCDYLESHARRVYSCVTTPQIRAAHELANRIKARKVGQDGSFSCRDVYMKGWSGLDSPQAVNWPLKSLQTWAG